MYNDVPIMTLSSQSNIIYLNKVLTGKLVFNLIPVTYIFLRISIVIVKHILRKLKNLIQSR